ncbi:MAG: hypothetical protein QOE80_4165 [Actinomycetota bacterium]|jgi:hypothetical protein|nr:hypothetical protein [Actinomycetota bacterium]
MVTFRSLRFVPLEEARRSQEFNMSDQYSGRCV